MDANRSDSHGIVVAVRGSVVDVRFDQRLPPIYSVLRAGENDRIVVEVLAQLDALHVRGIALTTTHGLARGQAGKDTGGFDTALTLVVEKAGCPRAERPTDGYHGASEWRPCEEST